MAKTAMRRVLCGPLLATALVLLPIAGFADPDPGPVTAENWLTHPMTKTVRRIYRSVEDGLASGTLRSEQRAFEYCEPYVDVLRAIASGGDGLPRKYRYERGSDDSALTVSHYYDNRGALRFVFARAGAVNGTVVEYRVYLDETGALFWRDYRLVEGPGYTFPDALPEKDLVRRPKAAFAAENGCPEPS